LILLLFLLEEIQLVGSLGNERLATQRLFVLHGKDALPEGFRGILYQQTDNQMTSDLF
jgi:hypothetical protein